MGVRFSWVFGIWGLCFAAREAQEWDGNRVDLFIGQKPVLDTARSGTESRRAMSLIDDLQSRTVIADGAMGTELWAAGVSEGVCLEELCVRAQETVIEVHKRYIASGARLLRTNSFGANSVRLATHGYEHRVGEINWTAAQLARDCARGTGAYVAGSVGPLGLTEAEANARGVDREAVFIEQIGALLDGGAQGIVLETFTDVGELLLAIHAKHSLHHCPVIALLAPGVDGNLPDGTPLADAFARLRAAEADLVGVNCIAPDAALASLKACADAGPLAAFPSAGLPPYAVEPAAFAKAGAEMGIVGVNLLGGCCGAGPAYITALAAEFPEP